MITQADIFSIETDALHRFTMARREGKLDLTPEMQSILDSMGVWWDEIEQEYFSMNQVFSDSVAALIKQNLPADN
tara:strand:+ start:592 stop:816 length:225 start_codon:yes stop_codon:yes gene_type:complete